MHDLSKTKYKIEKTCKSFSQPLIVHLNFIEKTHVFSTSKMYV